LSVPPDDAQLQEGTEERTGAQVGIDRRGSIRIDLGCAFSPVDGYGLVNAREAVLGR